MPLLSVRSRILPPSVRLLRAGFATQKHQQRAPKSPVPRSSANRPPPSMPLSRRPNTAKPPQAPKPPPEEKNSSVDSISGALRDASDQDNNLLSPVHVLEDPDGVLNENHPATSILSNSSLVVTRQLELMNVMLGFEQANKYVIMDPHGNHIGYIAERDLGMGNMMARQMFSTHRSFTTHVFDKHGKEVLRFHRPFAWISSRIGIYDPLETNSASSSSALATTNPGALTTEIDPPTAQVSSIPLSEMRIVGEAQQRWAPLRRKYNLFLHRTTDPSTPQLAAGDLPLSNTTAVQPSAQSQQPEAQFGQFAYVDEPFLSWDFSLMSADSRLIGSVNRNFAGFGREIFTDTGVYALRMDAAGLAQEPGHLISKSGKKAEVAEVGMTLDQRAIMLATAVSIDFDYFSRRSGSGGMGFLPLWFPGVGGGAAEAGADAGAVEGAGGAIGEGAEQAGKAGVMGAGGVAGYEAMQKGAYGDDASPTSGQQDPGSFGAGQSPPQQPGQVGQGEDVWGTGDDPWSKPPPGGEGGGGEGGGDGEGGWFDGLSDFFDS